MPMSLRRRRLVVVLVASPVVAVAQAPSRNVDWPVYQGNHDHTHYTTLSQISPANVAQLKVAWTYDTKDAFNGSEMQSNPVILNGVMYALSPKQRAFALDAAIGKEL
ncbi:MAG: pyrroloquinoline quinone-dependent dehydrogenase, partial [Gemmatimonadaceae bacterium]